MYLKSIFFLIILTGIQQLSFAQKTNTNEDLVPQFVLPPLLISEKGQAIKTREDWEKIRRPEVLKMLSNQMFGKVPDNQISVTSSEKVLNRQALGGKATTKEITFTFKNKDKSHEAVLLLFLPNKIKGKTPIFLAYNFDGNHTVFPDEQIGVTENWVGNKKSFGIENNSATALSRGAKHPRWPVLNIINRGYGLAVMYYGDIDPDFDDGFKNGVHTLFPKALKKSDWGSIATWAWGLTKVMDYIENQSVIDSKKVIVLGHSRLGKTALWAGAMDQRFAMVISNNSGCGGAALSKRKFGETVHVINTRFPHWFCDNFNQYNKNEESLPFDQHWLIALMAPRPVYIASAQGDKWADPKGEFLSGKYATPVYHFYASFGIEIDEMPKVDQPEKHTNIGYHIRSGKHDLTIYDWEQYLDFADMHFKN
jgi:hypothetical protein